MHFYLGFDSDKAILYTSHSDIMIETGYGYSIAIYGNVCIEGTKNDTQKIISYYERYQDEIVNYIEGLYHLFIFDDNKKCLSVYQDMFTGSEIIYYTRVNSTYHFSNTLNCLQKFSGKDYKICKNAQILFAKYGFVPEASTLIEDVYKISPFHKLVINGTHCKQKKIEYHFDIQEETAATLEWNDKIKYAIDSTKPNEKELSMPISGGYDSNYILYHLNCDPDNIINLYTIGGHVGMDESGCTRKIAKQYQRHHLTTAFTSNHMIDDLPDIVWRLGGSTFERGIFLQYRLAKELYRNGESTLICGECADQVMNINFLDDLRTTSEENCVGIENTYDFASYVIIKKSGIMLNSFGIQGFYPYTNQSFVNTALSVRHRNKNNKAYHKKNCEQIFDKEISKIIHKEGGATSFQSLFENERNAMRFCEQMEKTSLYAEITAMTPILPVFQKQRKTIIKKLFFEIPENVKLLKAKLEANSIETIFPAYKKKERRIRNSLIVLYLALFEELYCSERSEYYRKNGIKNFDLDNFINKL